MFRNYTDETYIKGFIPELALMLWAGEINYDKQKEKAEQVVINDFLARGYKGLFLRSDLSLRKSGNTINSAETTVASEKDDLTRLRLVVNVKAITNSTKTFTLQGSPDNTVWNDITTFTVTAISTKTPVFSQAYKYYRLVVAITSPGTIDYEAYLTETVYDLFFAYQWLYLILMDAKTAKDDQYDMKANDFKKLYDELWNTAYFVITDETGDVEQDKQGQLTLSRG